MSNIVSIILLIASVGLFFVYVDPTYVSIKELRAEKADYDQALNNSKELQAEKQKLLDKFNEMNPADLDKLVKLLPNNIDNIRLIIDIDEMAKSHNMRIRNFKADTGEKKDTIGKDLNPYGTLTLSFTTTAAYNTFLSFMRDLETSLRVIDIVGIDFKTSEVNQLYDYTVTIKTYWLK